MSNRNEFFQYGQRLTKRIVDKLFEEYDKQHPDDSEFAPFIRRVAEAVEGFLLDEKADSTDAVEAAAEIREYAIGKYVQLCYEHVPEEANAKEDRENFEYLMEHGKWPRGSW